MSDLVACPFCRQLFSPGETKSCPDCGLGLQDLAKLPPSYDAKIEYPEEPIPPHMETLPWTYAGRNRGLLLALSALGLLFFFTPWIQETAPELRELSGFGLAQLRGYFWAPAVAYFVMFPLVLTRRSVYKMRGARVAVGFLAGIVLTTVAIRLGFTPKSTALRPATWAWSWGLYATGATALAALIAALGFGGKLDDLPTRTPRRGDEVLH
ncbi:MAG: hypothetical protein U0359_04070 [Byssovorax sp.]